MRGARPAAASAAILARHALTTEEDGFTQVVQANDNFRFCGPTASALSETASPGAANVGAPCPARMPTSLTVDAGSNSWPPAARAVGKRRATTGDKDWDRDVFPVHPARRSRAEGAGRRRRPTAYS